MSKKDIIDYVMKTPGNTNKRVLGRLIDEVEGARLPEVTEDDNGNVLTVVEGVWNKAEPSGGSDSNCLIVHVKKENFNGYPAVFDPDEITPSVDDIFDAFEAGKDISVIVQLDFLFSDGNSSYTSTVEFALPLISWSMDTNREYMTFSVKSIYHIPFQGSDETERMVDIVTLTLWKTENRKAILYYGNEDIDH